MVEAVWRLKLLTVCPKCSADFDIMETVDVFKDGHIEPLEVHTVATLQYETECPVCETIFCVEFTR